MSETRTGEAKPVCDCEGFEPYTHYSYCASIQKPAAPCPSEAGLFYGCVACADPIASYGMCVRCSNAFTMGRTEERKQQIHGPRPEPAVPPGVGPNWKPGQCTICECRPADICLECNRDDHSAETGEPRRESAPNVVPGGIVQQWHDELHKLSREIGRYLDDIKYGPSESSSGEEKK